MNLFENQWIRLVRPGIRTESGRNPELIRKAVDTIIKSSTVLDREERHKRAMEIVGKFSSGKRDISKKHDLYVTDAYNK